ncbi:hypothetical protein [Stakelama pacifica]|uniref:DUF927 domain-containing protein n=1 Tax=Stakelama pacifica TaxID=517720 RepID=A0A4R6FPH8_9SPHN|nr:hypothetical protein [Stakelama pacifica]TDN83000.1 hypothetical protein EV664_105198 [Stakelama pacifica]
MASGGLDSVRQSASKPVDAPDLRKKKGDASAQYDMPFLPADAPIQPLGISGLRLYLLDSSQQLICCDTKLGKNDILLMVGDESWLEHHYPQRNKDGDVTGWDQKKSSAAIVLACRSRKIFKPQGRVFGRGAHRQGLDEELVLHMGNRVMVAGAADLKGRPGPLIEYPAGRVGERYYPAQEALPAPSSESSTREEAGQLLDLLRQWYWTEPHAAPLLALGMVAQMYICGALGWRSHMWLVGPTAAGKSSLQKLYRALLSDWCLHTEDASEAAIRQVLGDDTLPVMIDEAEADDNPEKQRAILNLAKKASSGAKMYRGSADHKAQEFTAQSCFLFSSVLHSIAKGEERNRMAILEMRQVPPRKADDQWTPPDLKKWGAIGRRMHRRMIEQWPRFDETLTDYKRVIASHGLEGRWQDTFGTLLACADCLMFDRAPGRESEANAEHGREQEWVRLILPMMARGKAEAQTDDQRCIQHLLYQTIPGAHGAAPETIAQHITNAMTPDAQFDDALTKAGEQSRHRLKQYGLRLIELQHGSDGEPLPKLAGEPLPGSWASAYLALAYPTCAPLVGLFERTEWNKSGYLQSLGKVEGAVRGLKMRFVNGAGADNAIAIPLSVIRGGDEE